MTESGHINFGEIIKKYPIRFDEFDLRQDQFFRVSRIHGIMHTYRVMIHVLNLGVLTGFLNEARTAFFAAYIHDMARKNDGYCTRHGADAAADYLGKYSELFEQNGASPTDLRQIALTVSLHSAMDNNLPDLAAQKVLFLLKDADALDRIRLGEDDLDPSYLRFDVTHQCIPFANTLYFKTYQLNSASFQQIIKIAEEVHI